MRARMYADGLRIDLINKRTDLLKVVELAAAAGLVDMRINPTGEGGSLAVLIHAADGAWASEVLVAMLALVAEIEGTTPERMLSSWREKYGQFDSAAKEIREAAAP